ncbi:MAG: response regulator, partial [Ilumatobacteraceae bacterium]
MKLLLVEDDVKIAAAVERGLEAEGFSVEVASTGDEGLWRAMEGSYDLILLDIMLPGRNGYRICADLRAAGDWTPILMLTAKDGDLDEAEGLDTGADDYLVKPFSFAVLVARVRALLRRTGGG